MQLPIGYTSVDEWTKDLVEFANQYDLTRMTATPQISRSSQAYIQTTLSAYLATVYYVD